VGQTLPDAIAAFSPALPLAVAYSGGADSTALLLACAEKWPGQVSAVHIHHGLQAAADDFQRHCELVCTTLNVPLVVKRVDARHAAGESPEAAARAARYQAFGALALAEWAQADIKTIAMAQHADDQVETILLALSRGAGLAGLAAMPAHWQRDGISFHRPLLDVSAADIRAWLAARGAGFVEDPSNASQQFTRNRIRAQLLPVLQSVFPHFRDTFARSAAHAAQAQALLAEIAAEDFEKVRAGADNVALKDLTLLSRPRQANVLRHWLRSQHKTTPSTAQLEELLNQVAACTTRGHQINIRIGSGFAKRQGVTLTWYNP
jgi:tRNA(Ile)-lysidine synthase